MATLLSQSSNARPFSPYIDERTRVRAHYLSLHSRGTTVSRVNSLVCIGLYATIRASPRCILLCNERAFLSNAPCRLLFSWTIEKFISATADIRPTSFREQRSSSEKKKKNTRYLYKLTISKFKHRLSSLWQHYDARVANFWKISSRGCGLTVAGKLGNGSLAWRNVTPREKSAQSRRKRASRFRSVQCQSIGIVVSSTFYCASVDAGVQHSAAVVSSKLRLAS